MLEINVPMMGITLSSLEMSVRMAIRSENPMVTPKAQAMPPMKLLRMILLRGDVTLLAG